MRAGGGLQSAVCSCYVLITSNIGGRKKMYRFGRRIRAARIAAGYQDATVFATDIGVEGKDYAKVEESDRELDYDALRRAARLTNKSIDFLLTGREAVAE